MVQKQRPMNITSIFQGLKVSEMERGGNWKRGIVAVSRLLFDFDFDFAILCEKLHEKLKAIFSFLIPQGIKFLET